MCGRITPIKNFSGYGQFQQITDTLAVVRLHEVAKGTVAKECTA